MDGKKTSFGHGIGDQVCRGLGHEFGHSTVITLINCFKGLKSLELLTHSKVADIQ